MTDISEIKWDLTQLFQSTDDPSISKEVNRVTELAEVFVTKYRCNIALLDANGVLTFLQEYEEFLEILQRLTKFATLSFSANMKSKENQVLYDKVNKLSAKLNQKLAFMQLELGKLVYSNPELITIKILANYKHYLEILQRRVPHQLSEIEEQIIIEKDQYGINAWSQLQSKWLNTRNFELEVEGVKKTGLSYGEANGLLNNLDRATRKSANHAIYSLLGQDGEVFSSALRNICNDWVNITKRRKFDSEIHKSLIQNDTEAEIIDNLMIAIDEGSAIYRKYLSMKAKLLGLPKLMHYDIAAPLPKASNSHYTWEDAKNLVIEAYQKFDEEYSQGVIDMFARNNVDASPRDGKRNGAFCSTWYKGKSAFILQSFTNSLSDVYTLAHEMGHAVHTYYQTQNQTMLNCQTGMNSAETASIFGELLLTDMLMKKAKTDVERQVILCRLLDSTGMGGFQVTARKWFEQDLYDAIKKGDFLDYSTICHYWTKNRDRIYGNSVHFDDVMESEWTMKPHYYRTSLRFYNYPYVYARFFVFTLYNQFLNDGEAFIPKFKKALAVGSSISPKEIGKLMGVDVSTPQFWKKGMDQFENFVSELEKLL
ncbi:MAG: M3 family metallopeptidase [Promethearchaeota archaeon]